MSGKRYSSQDRYRGRRDGSSVLKGLAVGLAVLLAAGVLFYFFLGKYIQYTDDGVRLVIPWLQDGSREELEMPQRGDVVVEEQESSVPAPASTEEQKLLRLEAVEVSVEEVLRGTAADTAKTAGGNALVVEVKNEEGYLAWDSRAEQALAAELTGSPDFRQVIADLDEAGELYLIARMSVFQDLWMCVHDKSMALTTASGKLWYDTYGMPWLSPANDSARQYMVQLCLELAEMGFDEILLERAAYPAKGKLSAVSVGANYPESGRDGIVSRWIGELTAALEGTGVVVSVRVKESELSQENGNSGWTAGSLALAGRVWLEAGAELDADAEVLASAGRSDARERLVQIWTEVPEDRSESWAVLSE